MPTPLAHARVQRESPGSGESFGEILLLVSAPHRRLPAHAQYACASHQSTQLTGASSFVLREHPASGAWERFHAQFGSEAPASKAAALLKNFAYAALVTSVASISKRPSTRTVAPAPASGTAPSGTVGASGTTASAGPVAPSSAASSVGAAGGELEKPPHAAAPIVAAHANELVSQKKTRPPCVISRRTSVAPPVSIARLAVEGRRRRGP